MGNGKVNWDSQETWQRVVAAILATGVKVDLKQTALYFGTTYDTLENRFRKIKKSSEVLKQEVMSGERGAEICTPSKKSNKDALMSVVNGRVAKSTTTPKKKEKKKSGVKLESFEDSIGGFGDGGEFSFGNGNGSFDLGHGVDGEDEDGLDLLV